MAKDTGVLKIAIDGPAGSGKSTVAREVSRRLEITYLDTGAMYRAITLKVVLENIDLNDLEALEGMLEETEIRLGKDRKIYLDGVDVTEEIRKPHVNEMVSPVSCISAVRRHLVAMQQTIADQSNGIIMEGRDIASWVMPDADFKFYLDATIEERAKRRCKEQLEKGIVLSLPEVSAEIKNRDNIDSHREDSPLTIVADAIVVDTTGMTIVEVVDRIIELINEGMR